MKTKHMKTLPSGNSISRSPLPRPRARESFRSSFSEGGSLITSHYSLLPVLVFALTCLSLSPTPNAFGVLPPPDGGYPNFNTAEGDNALFSLTTGSANTAIGEESLFQDTTGSNNTAIGTAALGNNTTGDFNTASGFRALVNNTTATFNTGTGAFALQSNTTGNENTANGALALVANTTGNNNIAFGVDAGINLTTGDNNIDIGNRGVAAEANTVRIGTQGTQTKTFMAGIYGTAISGTPVKINSSGQLGVAPSSARFKQNVHKMDKASDVLLALRPVTFRYKPEIDPEGSPQFGLVAEEVEKVNRDLVVYDEQHKPYTVRYDAVNAMLLNEFLKAHRTVQELKSTAAKQEATITQLKSTVAQQQKGMEVLTAGLKEQAARIQRVTAQIELGKPAPQVVDNNQ